MEGHEARVLAGLDDEQLRAVTAPAGPVCILAGAGTGKTRAITHRIAYRVAQGTPPGHFLAVTFTARAAGELRDRLRGLGASGVSARTFHASALRLLRYFAPRLWGHELPDVIDSKVRLITVASARAGVRLDRTGARDVASEIEWAKSSLIDPTDYPTQIAKIGREAPLPAEQIVKIFQEYERTKRSGGVIDFEDMLRAAVWAIEQHPDVAAQVRGQYRHLVVDEYQDVNPVQQRLLEAWLGDGDDLTVVGDASQTIYSFTGASATHLIEFPKRHRDAVVVRLVRDYRSTPQIVALANETIARATGEHAKVRLELRGQRPAGPEPAFMPVPDEPAEADAVAVRCAELIKEGVSPREIAVLFRTNAQSEAYEQALTSIGVPYVVRGGERFFERPEIRQAMIALRTAARQEPQGSLPEVVREAMAATGWAANDPPPGGAAREKWEALAALVRLAAEFDPETTLPEFVEELARRAVAQHAPVIDGVTLASLHAAKGLEWDAVFLVGLAEGTMPISHARTPAQVEEERRLFYVGVTRARQWLSLSWSAARSPGGRPRRPSRFLPRGVVPDTERSEAGTRGSRRKGHSKVVSCRICGTPLHDGAERKVARCAGCPSDLNEELFERLREWRIKVATLKGQPAFVVFTDATLTAIAEREPSDSQQLVAIPGIGPFKLSLYAEPVLALVSGASVESAVELVAATIPPAEAEIAESE